MSPSPQETPPPDPHHAERRTLEFTSTATDVHACLDHFLLHRSRWIGKRYALARQRIDALLGAGLLACVLSIFLLGPGSTLYPTGKAWLGAGVITLGAGATARLNLGSRRQSMIFALTSPKCSRLPQLASSGRCRLTIDEAGLRLTDPNRTISCSPVTNLRLERHAQTLTVLRENTPLLVVPIAPINDRCDHLPVLLDLVQRPGSIELAIIDYLAQFDFPCPKCKYNLRGNTLGACPECGRAVTPWDLPVRRTPLLPDSP